MTQNEKVLDYMERFGSITQIEALSDLGIMRLASRINDLKKKGYCVKKKWLSQRIGMEKIFSLQSIVWRDKHGTSIWNERRSG